MRIAVIEHHAEPSLAVVGQTAQELGADIDIRWGVNNDAMPALDEHDGLVVLGGAMHAADDERCPYFPELIQLIRDYTAAEKPVLGICLGSQLVARAFGAPLHLDQGFEFGYHPIEPLEGAAGDVVMSCMETTLPIFQWHTDHYDLPAGAVHLATNENYPYQAYRIGKATYATQFHFEADRETVESWISHYPRLDDRAPGYAEWLPRQFVDHEENSKTFCREFVRRWMALAG